MKTYSLWASLCAVCAALVAGCGESSENPCSGVDCGGHGECVPLKRDYFCKCEDGYAAVLHGCEASADGDEEQGDPEPSACDLKCAGLECGTTNNCLCGTCGKYPDRPMCNESTNMCVACFQQSDCGAGKVCNAKFECADDPGGCSALAANTCLNGDVYALDSCGNYQIKKEDCGETQCDAKYCDGMTIKQSCLNKSCENGACKSETKIKTVKECEQSYCDSYACSQGSVVRACYENGCLNGACTSRKTVETIENCGTDQCDANYCNSGSVYKSCLKRGCKSGACYYEYKTELVAECGEDSCYGRSCQYSNVVEECLLRGCQSGACFENTETRIVEYCAYGCSGGACSTK